MLNKYNSVIKNVMMDKIYIRYEDKIKLTNKLIKEFYEKLDGNVYISFSGGLDSTVLLNMVRTLYPDCLAIRIIEPSYKELNDFVNCFDHCKQLMPKLSFNEILNKYGYPIISKEVSKNISRYRNTNDEDVKKYRLYGIKKDGSKGMVGVIPKKWKYLIDAPFKISDRCCDIIKKNPIRRFEKQSNLKPYLGIKALDSNSRLLLYLKYGCNVFKGNKIKSNPLIFWNDNDIWKYIRDNKINYCGLYNKGEKNLGCIYCLFGIQYEKIPNRIQRMYNIDKRLYRYAFDKLNYSMVLDYINVQYRPISQINKWC